jgi:LysM repeat protein
MGTHRRIGAITRRAAAGTAAFALVPAAAFIMSGPSAPHDVSRLPRVNAALTSAQPASQQAARQQKGSDGPATYTVQPGDSLSTIAKRQYHQAAAWPVLYWANHGQIRWADDIEPGQILRVPARPGHIPAAPAALAPAPPRPRAVVQDVVTTATSARRVTTTADTSYTDAAAGLFQSCVISRESGGDAQVMNASGHYGLYQFSYSTWASYGGNPADFGHASTAEQNQVFDTALSEGGEDNWAPYDGC